MDIDKIINKILSTNDTRHVIYEAIEVLNNIDKEHVAVVIAVDKLEKALKDVTNELLGGLIDMCNE